MITATPTTAPSDEATAELVTTLRDDVIPKATNGKDMTASVGGTTASYVDLADEISSRLVLTILIVIALSFVLLMLAFRSLVIPLTAGLMNLRLDRRRVRRGQPRVRGRLRRRASSGCPARCRSSPTSRC